MKWLPRTFAGRLWLIVGIACVIRVAFVWQVRETLAEPWGYALAPGTDMPKYVRYARMVLAGNFLAEDVTISPLAPLVVLPLLLLLAGGNLVGAMMWQGVLGSAQVGFIGLIGRRFVSEPAALVAAGLAALYAPFIVHDAVPLTETTINVCFLLTVWTYLRLREKPSAWRALATGAGWGLAIAAKPTMVVLLPLPLLGDWIERGWARVAGQWRHLGIAVAIAGMVVLPFILRARWLGGEWLFLRGNTSYMVLMGNHPGASGKFQELSGEFRDRFEAEVGREGGGYRRRDAVAARWVHQFWIEHPAEAARLLLRKARLLFAAEEIPNNIAQAYYEQISFLKWPVFLGAGLLWPLGGLGLAVAWGRRRSWSVVLVLFAGYAAVVVMTIAVARLRLPLLPAAMLLAAAGMVWLYNEGQRLDRLRVAAAGAVVLVMLALNQRTLARWWRPTIQPTGQRERLPEGWFYRDGLWDTAAAYSVWIETAEGEIRKRLIVEEGKFYGVAAVEVKFRCMASGAGAFLVRLNECEREVEFTPELCGQNLIASFPFPPSCVRPDNQIVFRVRPGTRLRVFLDDAWSYGRSAVREAGEDFLHDGLGYRAPRPPHTIGGEFQVGLLMRRERTN